MKTTYEIIRPPFEKNLRDMSKVELKQYFKWFLDELPKRMDILEGAVHATHGFENWQADYTPSSLSLIGRWFATQVETRSRSDAEMEKSKEQQIVSFDVAGDELTNRTFSIAMDIGIYLGQVFLKNNPSLKWVQDTSDKKFIDYGQSLIVGFGSVPLNPVSVAVVLAYGLASKKKTGDRLLELYDIWQRRIDPSS